MVVGDTSGDHNHDSRNGGIETVSRGHTTATRRAASSTKVLITRPPFTQAAFDELHLKNETDDNRSCCQKFRDKLYCSRKRFWRLLTSYIPVIKFIRYYKVKENAIYDIFAGLSVGTLHIPQSLAFGLLASVKIENGLFTSLWPVLIYVFFGTSAHVTMGPSAVICILTAATVDRVGEKWVEDKPWILNQTGNGTTLDDIPEYMDFKEEMAMGVTLVTGIFLVIMGFLKLGFITFYLSDSFFSAFTSAAAVHIGTSQLPSILGITIPKFGGIFKIIKTYEAIFDRIEDSRFASIIIALICCGLIWFVKEGINEKYKDKMFAPIPIELFVVVFSTIASYFGDFQERFEITVVGDIPTGIPKPYVPTRAFEYANDYIVDSLVMAILIFAYTIAIAKIMAKKHNYEVDNSQEMLSYGICNLGSSFLRCIPSCVAPPRSMVASTMNAKTTLNGIFSAGLMLLFILIVAQLFAELPTCVLGAIIFISLKNLFIQIGDFLKYWHINKFDFFIWFFTFFGTVFLDLDVGLGLGVGISIITVVFQTQFAQGYKLGYTASDPTLVPHKRYLDSAEIPGLKVFRYESSLYFANAEIFRTNLYWCTVNPRKLLKALKKKEKLMKNLNEITFPSQNSCAGDGALGIENRAYQSSVSYSNALGLPDRSVMSVTNGICQPQESNNLGRKLTNVNGAPRECNGAVRMDGSEVKKVKVSHFDLPVFTVDGHVPLFLDDTKLGLRSPLNDSSRPAMLKLDKRESVEKGQPKVVPSYSIDFDDFYTEDPDDGEIIISDERLRLMRLIHHVIIDCSPITYIDVSGTNVLCQIHKEYSHVNIELFLAGCSASVRQIMRRAGVFDTIPQDNFFVDVHDAVSFARPQRPQPIGPEQLEDFTEEEAIEGSRMMY